MKNHVKKSLKASNGITLIALVITIIILLILAGISIGMLSGDNSIINQAGNAKTQTDISQEKEIIDIAVVHAMGKSKYGDIDETSFTNELEKNNATVTKSGSKYKVAFTSGRQYTVDSDGNVKEKNPNSLEISELYENGSTYFGWDVINYAETLPENLQDTKWQLFYAGALDIDQATATALGLTEAERTEERIWLISKEYVKNTLLPAKNGATPIPVDGSEYKAKFGSSTSDGIMPQYTSGSSLITQAKIKALNSDYFKDYTSTKENMRAVAYMLDTDVWSPFATSTQGYAEYAIGGPTVELLFIAYNKYKGLTGSTAYVADAVSTKGYQISINGGTNYVPNYAGMIGPSAVPYTVYENSNESGYWLASPSSNNADRVMRVSYYGDIGPNIYNNMDYGFRPLVLLSSNFQLEKTTSGGKEVFQIVPKTE